MNILGTIAQKAYLQRLDDFSSDEVSSKHGKDFIETIKESLERVNDLQIKKDELIKEFAVGETQNIHELMIAIQKANIAVKLTTAIRNKVLEAYKQMINMPI